jgi:hypothetical protein
MKVKDLLPALKCTFTVSRHCEEQRSEAIHKDFPGLPRRYAPRNDEAFFQVGES